MKQAAMRRAVSRKRVRSGRKYCYEYPRAALTVDAVVFALASAAGPKLKVLLIQRKHAPFAGKWALPGGFLEPGETVEQAVKRELAEETGLRLRNFVQVKTFSDPKRDPREHVVTVAFLALVRSGKQKIRAKSDAAQAAWFDPDAMPRLAFDHSRIISEAMEKLKSMHPECC